MERHYLAVDLGAESGRVMHGVLSQGRLTLEEIHRFPNAPVKIHGSLRWNLVQLFAEIIVGLRKAGQARLAISGISCDAWGVDYAFVNDSDPMVSLPYHYRDERTDAVMEKVFGQVSSEAIFNATGIQFMSINTLYQLWTDVQTRPEILAAAKTFLNIGDYFNYLLCGSLMGERTVAGTTQLLDPRTGNWAWGLIEKLRIPKNLFPKLNPPGSLLTPLLPDIARETGLTNARLVATCSHDTAAAVAAIPAVITAALPGADISPRSSASNPAKSNPPEWAFLSSGTWSLLGAELNSPLINTEVRAANFTNECGYGDTIMFRKNIVGLWIVQECRRAWAEAGQEFNYDELTRLAAESPAFKSLIRPDDPRFGKPGRMPEKIAEYCRETGQPAPQGVGPTVRCVLESLALLYAETLNTCARLTGKKFALLHVVGGGSKNRLLNEFTSSALGIPVEAGPAEATAIGNLLIQARTLGHLEGGIRQVVRDSFPTETVPPKNPEAWSTARKSFGSLADMRKASSGAVA